MGLPAIATQYYTTVMSLTPKTDQMVETPVPQTPAEFIWLPLVIFILLFISASGILLSQKIKNWKKSAVLFLLAFFIAGIPFAISSIREGFSTTTKASPDETPRSVVVREFKQGSVVVSWETDKKGIGAVRYWPDTVPSEAVVKIEHISTQKHTVVLTGLSAGASYELEIVSGKSWYDNHGVPVRFTLDSL